MSHPQDGAETERPAPAPTGVGETEARCRSLFDVLPAGVLVLEPAGTILYSNAVAQEIFGRSIAQLEGRSLVDSAFTPVHVDGTPIPPDERPLERAVQSGAPVRDVALG
jgi:PAS domain-containing protein